MNHYIWPQYQRLHHRGWIGAQPDVRVGKIGLPWKFCTSERVRKAGTGGGAGQRETTPTKDSLIVAAAIEGECAVLYSEDLRSGQRFGDMEITNPF